jgi:hypothetical protein
MGAAQSSDVVDLSNAIEYYGVSDEPIKIKGGDLPLEIKSEKKQTSIDKILYVILAIILYVIIAKATGVLTTALLTTGVIILIGVLDPIKMLCSCTTHMKRDLSISPSFAIQ